MSFNAQALSNIIPLVGDTIVELIKIVESFKAIQSTNIASQADVNTLWKMVSANDDAAIAAWHKEFAAAKIHAASNQIVVAPVETETVSEDKNENTLSEQTALDHAAQGSTQ